MDEKNTVEKENNIEETKEIQQPKEENPCISQIRLDL